MSCRFCWPSFFLTVLLSGVGGADSFATIFPSRPFVLVNSNELAVLRLEISQPGWKRDVYRAGNPPDFAGVAHAIKPNADLWLHREIVIPARGGHIHWFYCDDGTQLTVPGNQEFAPGPYRCPTCGRIYDGEKYEAAVRRFVHQWLSLAARDLALVAAIENKPEYAAKSAEILCKYADAYPGPHTSLTEGGLVYQSLDEAMWVIPLAQAFDLIHDQLTLSQQSEISRMLKTVAGGLQHCGTDGNWGSWHLSAMGVIGYATEDSDLVAWATEAFHSQIRNQLGDDGLWPESVQTYHFFPLQAFQFFAEAAWHAGVDLYRWEGKPGKSLTSMYAAPLDYAYPNLQLPAINDGWYRSFLPVDDYELAWHRLHDSTFAWVLNRSYGDGRALAVTNVESAINSRRDGLYAFLFGGALPADAMKPASHSINFPVLGIACLRATNGAMITFDYGAFLGHGHLDKMGVTFFAGGKLWVADYGTPGYGAEILPWYRSTFAHNTIVVDGKDQSETKENSARLWLDKPFLEAAQSTTREAYPGITHIRTVVRVGDCFIIRDQLQSSQSHDYDFCLRAEGTLRSSNFASAGRPQQSGSKWIQDLQAFAPTNSIEVCWQNGDDAFYVRLIGGNALIPMTAKCPAETGSRQLDLLMVRQSGNTAEFVTALCPPGKTLAIQRGARDGILKLAGSVEGILKFPSAGHAPQLSSAQ